MQKCEKYALSQLIAEKLKKIARSVFFLVRFWSDEGFFCDPEIFWLKELFFVYFRRFPWISCQDFIRSKNDLISLEWLVH